MDLIQLGWLESKVEEVKKENQIWRSMLNQVTQQHYALLQNKLLVETMQQQQQQQNQQSSSPNKINKQIIMEDDRASELTHTVPGPTIVAIWDWEQHHIMSSS